MALAEVRLRCAANTLALARGAVASLRPEISRIAFDAKSLMNFPQAVKARTAARAKPLAAENFGMAGFATSALFEGPWALAGASGASETLKRV